MTGIGIIATKRLAKVPKKLERAVKAFLGKRKVKGKGGSDLLMAQ